MSKALKEVIITDLNEHIGLTNKYLNKEAEVRNNSQLANWSEQLVLLAFTGFNALTNKREKYENDKPIYHQQRSYEKMKLSFSFHHHHLNTGFNKSVSHDSVVVDKHVLVNQPSVTKQISSNQPLLTRQIPSRNGSYDTMSDDSQSDSQSQTSSSSLSSLEISSTSTSSSYGYGSYNDISEARKNENIRVVERFGSEFYDKCLFPLALTLDASDLSKGKLTWDAILTKADLVLYKWQHCSNSLRKVNRVLASPSDFVRPSSTLQNKFLLHPRARTSLKRWNSYEDLLQLKHEQRSVKNSSYGKKRIAAEDMLFTRGEFKIIEKVCNNQTDLERKSSKLGSVQLDSSHVEKPKQLDAKCLIRSIKINNPTSLALQITKIDKSCFEQLKSEQIFSCLIGRHIINQNNDMTELNVLLEFGDELYKLVVAVIRKEITPDKQANKIAGFIELACLLRKLRNWHSLCIVINALQSPKIYFMEEAWMSLKRTYPIHYNDYLKLCRLVRTCETCIIGSSRSSIPSIHSLISSLRIHCVATWDLLENKRRWTEQPSIAGWLDNELIGQLVESQKMREKQQEENYILSLDKKECSLLLPINDTIRFIHYKSLPINWSNRDVMFIPACFLALLRPSFFSAFTSEIHLIHLYSIPNYYS